LLDYDVSNDLIHALIPSHVQFETDIVVSRAAGTKHSLLVAQSQSVIERHDPIEILASFENITQEGATDDVSAGPEIAVAAVTQPPLSLRNSFDMLTSDCELPHGEALLEDSDNFVDSLDLFNNISEFDKGFPVNRQKSKAPISFETRPSDFPLLASNKPVMTQEPGDCAYIAAIDASVKVTLDNNTSHPSMPQPVTTYYDSLTSDKLPSNQNLVHASKPSLHSAAALKSVQILSKFWGDEVVEEDSDEVIISIFEQHHPSLSESTKAERKQKKQANKVKPTSFNSAGMRTRAQKGTPKASLAYTE
jgi:hypothetical protein